MRSPYGPHEPRFPMGACALLVFLAVMAWLMLAVLIITIVRLVHQ